MRTVEARVREVNWSEFETAYGPANRVGNQLIALASTDEDIALKAASGLWEGLCHQHVYVSSAALPAVPFIIEALRNATPLLTVEILDILLGFVVCTTPPSEYREEWKQQLNAKLVEELPLFVQFVEHENEDVRHFARSAIELLAP